MLTDAAHLLSDVSGFGVSLWAAWYATRRSQSTHTFGCVRLPLVLELFLHTGVCEQQCTNSEGTLPVLLIKSCRASTCVRSFPLAALVLSLTSRACIQDADQSAGCVLHGLNSWM